MIVFKVSRNEHFVVDSVVLCEHTQLLVLTLSHRDGRARQPEHLLKHRILIEILVWVVHNHPTDELWRQTVIVSALFWIVECFLTDQTQVIHLSTIKHADVIQACDGPIEVRVTPISKTGTHSVIRCLTVCLPNLLVLGSHDEKIGLVSIEEWAVSFFRWFSQNIASSIL